MTAVNAKRVNRIIADQIKKSSNVFCIRDFFLKINLARLKMSL